MWKYARQCEANKGTPIVTRRSRKIMLGRNNNDTSTKTTGWGRTWITPWNFLEAKLKSQGVKIYVPGASPESGQQ